MTPCLEKKSSFAIHNFFTVCSNIMILDIHTHHAAPQPEAIINLRVSSVKPELVENQLYSAGIHPWDLPEGDIDAMKAVLESIAGLRQVVAIGECGIDPAKGGLMFRQLQVMKLHIELSERLKKPLVVHDVKAHDIIVGLRRDLKPSMPWIIHGFRGKPQVAEMLLKSGCMLSFGEKFNAETLKMIPKDSLFAETDESQLSIEEIIGNLSAASGEDVRENVASNAERLFMPEVRL